MRGRLMNGTVGLAGGALFLFLLLGVFPVLSRVDAAEDQVGRTCLAVERITCGACLRVIDAELRKVPGVLGMTADLPARRVTVDHEPAVTPDEVAAAITGAGFPARVLENQSVPRGEAKLFERGPGFGSGPGCCNPGGSNPVADAWRELCRRFMGKRGCDMRPDNRP